MVESKLPHQPSSTNERPQTVRRRNTELHARVNGNLALEFTEAKLTSYAGLELFDRYLRRIGFSDLVRTGSGQARLGGDFGVVAMMRVLIGLLVEVPRTRGRGQPSGENSLRR